ncbi:unnamed protein product [Discula destructiva]
MDNSLAAKPRRMVSIALVFVLFTIWAVRFLSPSSDSLFAQLGYHHEDGGVQSANETTFVPSEAEPTSPKISQITTYITAQQATDPGTAEVDMSDADAPFIVWPLKRVCAEQTAWVEGLVFVCDNNFGGIGNMRIFILTCIRYAIDAGATGLTMPRIRKRGEDIGSLFENDIRPFDYLFDAEHFRGAMAQSCPQITLYNDDYSDIPNTHNLADVPRVNFVRVKEGKEASTDSIDPSEPVPVHVIVPKDYRCHLTAHVPPSYLDAAKHNSKEPRKAAEEARNLPRGEERDEPERDDEGGDAGNGDCREFHHGTERWGDNFRQWLFDEARIEQSKVPAPSIEKPFLVRMAKWVLFQYAIEKDGPEFRNTFGQLLKFNRPVMNLGKKVLGKMQDMSAANYAERVSSGLLDQDVHKSTVINNDERGFLGLHLRTESDVTHAGWPIYDELKDGFLAKAIEHGFQGGLAYVATGNIEDARRFESEAREAIDLKVVDKRTLLADEPEALAELEAMNWDHQGLVDYVVMVASEMLVGSSRSSFSMWLCVRRGVMVDGGLYARPYRPRVNRDDGASFVVGPKEKYWHDWLSFYDTIWP